jgi:thioredoxin 1
VQRRYSRRSRIGVETAGGVADTEGMTTASSFTQATDDTFAAEVLESDVPVLVDFWAAWCGPCRAMHPILDELAGERDDIKVVSVDVDANQAVAAQMQILSMPTFLLIENGAEKLRLIGSRPKRKLVAELDEALAASGTAVA